MSSEPRRKAERKREDAAREREREREGGYKDGRQRQIAAFNRLPWGAAEGDREGERHIWREREGEIERKRHAF